MWRYPLPENSDQWKTLHQVLPANIYDRFMIQIKRIARCNGIAVEIFSNDDKFQKAHGPRVMTYESLIILLERTEDDSVLRV
jgi:hypothetical protein